VNNDTSCGTYQSNDASCGGSKGGLLGGTYSDWSIP
jgi:hypothetical protein